MRNFVTLFLLFLILQTGPRAFAAPPNAPVGTDIYCYVGETMEWDTTGGEIYLSQITTQSSVVTGSVTYTLYTNGSATVSANNTTDSRLHNEFSGSDYLVTEYRLEYDGDGSSATGGSTVDWTSYSSFLSTPSAITHVSGDGAVGVTLKVRASNRPGTVADSGDYIATQTLTASWAG